MRAVGSLSETALLSGSAVSLDDVLAALADLGRPVQRLLGGVADGVVAISSAEVAAMADAVVLILRFLDALPGGPAERAAVGVEGTRQQSGG